MFLLIISNGFFLWDSYQLRFRTAPARREPATSALQRQYHVVFEGLILQAQFPATPPGQASRSNPVL
jgi:hypothetical protein